MKIKGILFDVNGTLVDIHTDELNEEIYRGISNFLTYQGLEVPAWELREEYFRIMDKQRRSSDEKFPEFDVVGLWREFLVDRTRKTTLLASDKMKWLPLVLAEIYRGLSLFRLQLYPDVREVLDELRQRFKLGAISDAQTPWARPEMRAVAIDSYFNPIVVSGDLGYRKPDKRIFELALKNLGLPRENVIFVGNDMYRDIYGARKAGLKTVFFWSNQGRKKTEGADPDYIIYRFAELRQAIAFLETH